MTRLLHYSHALRFIALVILMSLLPGIAPGQIQQEGEPLARQSVLSGKELEDTKQEITLSVEQLSLRNQLLRQQTPPGQPMQAGFSIPVSFNPETHGTWQSLGDSLWVWQLKLHVEHAQSLGLIFHDFELGDHSRLFVYTRNAEDVAGAFTKANNSESRVFSTQGLPGETVIVEYQEKISSGADQRFEISSFSIDEVIYLVNGLTAFGGEKELGDSEDCMLSVNCPEGDRWQQEKRGVARLLMREGEGWYWCSGTLVNNTRQDGTPYLLTADHCAANASEDDMDVWQFYFNFERPGCEDVGAPLNNVLYGSSLVAHAPLDGGSDFKLVQLHQRPPLAWRPYYNGWHNLDVPAESGVGIHHPAGDAKMISTFDGNVVSGGGNFSSGEEMPDDSAWRFPFIETENGHSVTQGGSSGSPMFNQDGLVVGTLSGGSSSCDSPNGVNIYGKMSYHWSNNHDHPTPQLGQHLDTESTGRFFLNAYDPYIENHPPPGFVTARHLDDDAGITIEWFKPGHAPNREGWVSYTSEYIDQTDEGPERATVFDAASAGFSYPVTVSAVSHIFRESPNDLWENDAFVFRIYDETGYDLVYSSPSLTAENLEEVIHEIDPPLTFEDRFYVSVNPAHDSGHPASAYDITNLGNSLSYVGFPQEWEPAGDDANQFVYLTSVFAEDSYPKNDENVDSGADRKAEKGELLKNDSQRIASFDPYDKNGARWSNLPLSYRVYKNDEPIHTYELSEKEQFEFTDEDEVPDEGFSKYHVTAVYPPGSVESIASPAAFIFFDQDCGGAIAEFPFLEDFDDAELPVCWGTEGVSEQSWSLTTGYAVDDQSVEPLSGDHFMVVHPDADKETAQDEWLLTPEFQLDEQEQPALRFAFHGNVPGEEDSGESLLSVYISVGGNAFTRIWDASGHPRFGEEEGYQWLQTVLDLSAYTGDDPIRIGFRYDGNGSVPFGLDVVEVLDQQDAVYTLSVIQNPPVSGEVYGAGSYIHGEKVTVEAYPNTPYFFHYWADDTGELTYLPEYSFLMPEAHYQLKAYFTLDNVTHTDSPGTSGDEFHVFPNPSGGRFDLTSRSEHRDLMIRILDARGTEIYHDTYSRLSAHAAIPIDISGHPDGIYLLQVRSQNGQELRKIKLSR